MCFNKIIRPTKRMSYAKLVALFLKNGVTAISIVDPLDSEYVLGSKAELDEIASSLVYPADWYVANIWDCEDYGLQAMLDASRLHGFSAIRLGLGNMPLGYHGFAITIDTSGKLWCLEPNGGFPHAGESFAAGENGYQPKTVLL